MGNIAPRAGFEATPLAFCASVLIIASRMIPDVICLCAERSVQTTTVHMAKFRH